MLMFIDQKNPGPIGLLTGGVHGDEINGVEILRESMEKSVFDNLSRGSLIVIPLLNIYGFINFSRETPDGKDVNRSFPGSLSGSLSSRVARTLTKEILPLIDFGVDFHTGGAARYNYPQIRFTPHHSKSRELAFSFAAPFTIGSTPLTKSWRKVAFTKDVPIIVYEGGESLRYDGFSIQKGIEGLKRVLSSQSMIEKSQEPPKTIEIKKMTWQRSSKAGMFKWSKQSGDWISEGEPIGLITDPFGKYKKTVLAKKSGYIVGHNNAPVVSLGDPLFHIGYDWEA